jgi:hypothetical protein
MQTPSPKTNCLVPEMKCLSPPDDEPVCRFIRKITLFNIIVEFVKKSQ